MCLLEETELKELAEHLGWVRFLAPNEEIGNIIENRVCEKCAKAPKLIDTNWSVLYCRHSFWDDFADLVAQTFPKKQFWVMPEACLCGPEVSESCEGRLCLYESADIVEEEIKDTVKQLNEDKDEEDKYDEDNWFPQRLEEARINVLSDIHLTLGEKHLILYLQARGSKNEA